LLRVILELEMSYPYSQSLLTLLEFCGLWDCDIIKAGSHSSKSTISMPTKFFKVIFGENPIVGKDYEVPKGTENFIVKIIVKKVKVKVNDKDENS
jgi:hypothetical protein